jgi:tetratricopeptide (TPR) repeat protein
MSIALVLLVVNLKCDLDLARQAQVAYTSGRYAEAETGFRHLAQQDCGASQTIANWSSLASTLRAEGKFSESEEWFQKATDTAKERLTPADPVWAQLLNSYALLDDELGRVAVAEGKFRQALSHLPVSGANIRTNLARLYTRLGRLDEAAKLQEEALRSEQHNAAQWMNLAMIRRRQGRDAESEQLLRQGLELSRSTVGEAHPYTITARSNLAQLLASRGDRDGAAKIMQTNISLWAKTYSTSHPTYAKLLTNLAALYFEKKHYAIATPLLSEALEINVAALGPRHPDVAKNAHDLGTLRHAQGRRPEAEGYYRQALEIQSSKPEYDRERMDTLANLGVLYQQWKRMGEAEDCYRQLLKLAPGVMPSEEARLGKALEYYEQLLRQRREVVDAERVAMLAMRFRVRNAVRQERYSKP